MHSSPPTPSASSLGLESCRALAGRGNTWLLRRGPWAIADPGSDPDIVSSSLVRARVMDALARPTSTSNGMDFRSRTPRRHTFLRDSITIVERV